MQNHTVYTVCVFCVIYRRKLYTVHTNQVTFGMEGKETQKLGVSKKPPELQILDV